MALVCSVGLSACCTSTGPIETAQVTQEITPETKTGLYHFRFDKAQIAEIDKAELDQLAEFLLINPQLKAHVEGYADIRGSSAYNLALGMRRAHAVSSYLQEKGIAPERINVHSFGAEKLVDMGTSNEAHAHNRRAVVYFEAQSDLA